MVLIGYKGSASLSKLLKLDVHVKRLIIDEIDSYVVQQKTMISENMCYEDLFGICMSEIRLSADFMWLITATPQRLLVDICPKDEGKSVFRYEQKVSSMTYFPISMFLLIPKSKLKHIVIRNCKDFIKESLNLPSPLIITVICQKPPYMLVAGKYLLNKYHKLLDNHDYQGLSIAMGCNITTPIDLIHSIEKQLTLNIRKTEYEIKHLQIIQKDDPEYYEQLKGFDQIDPIKPLDNQLIALNTRKESIISRLEGLQEDACSICLTSYCEDVPAVLECCKNILCINCALMLKVGSRCCFLLSGTKSPNHYPN